MVITDHDRQMHAKGYVWKVIDKSSSIEPLYAKTLKDVANLHREWPLLRFETICLPQHPEVKGYMQLKDLASAVNKLLETYGDFRVVCLSEDAAWNSFVSVAVNPESRWIELR